MVTKKSAIYPAGYQWDGDGGWLREAQCLHLLGNRKLQAEQDCSNQVLSVSVRTIEKYLPAGGRTRPVSALQLRVSTGIRRIRSILLKENPRKIKIPFFYLVENQRGGISGWIRVFKEN